MSSHTEGELPDSIAQVEQNLRRMNDEWVRALIEKDTVTLNRLMDDMCLFTDALIGDDKAQFIADIESNDLEVDSLTRDNVEVRVFGSTAVMTALDTADWKYKGRSIRGHYRTIHVYAEREGVWKIVAIQASNIEFK
jgi:ketosteroid isomerase-like protein